MHAMVPVAYPSQGCAHLGRSRQAYRWSLVTCTKWGTFVDGECLLLLNHVTIKVGQKCNEY